MIWLQNFNLIRGKNYLIPEISKTNQKNVFDLLDDTTGETTPAFPNMDDVLAYPNEVFLLF